MSLEKLALGLVVCVCLLWVGVMMAGAIATLPFGLPVLIVLLIVIYFAYRIIRDRLTNAEDDYYEKNVER